MLAAADTVGEYRSQIGFEDLRCAIDDYRIPSEQAQARAFAVRQPRERRPAAQPQPPACEASAPTLQPGRSNTADPLQSDEETPAQPPSELAAPLPASARRMNFEGLTPSPSRRRSVAPAIPLAPVG